MNSEHSEYYREADLEKLFNIDPDFFKFRQIRLMTNDGFFIKVSERVHNAEDLRTILQKYPHRKAYYTAARFQNPQQIGPIEITGPGYEVADSMFIYQPELVLDLDISPVENAEKVREYVADTPGIQEKYTIFSGGKGIHIALELEYRHPGIQDVREREEWYRKRNRAFLRELSEKGVDVDPAVANTRQIVKIPLSLSDGNPCKFLNQPSEYEDVSPANPAPPTVPPSKEAGDDAHQPHNVPGGGPNRAQDPAHIFTISNNVLGTQNRLTLLVQYDKDAWRVNALKKYFDYFLEKYRLREVHLFESSEQYTLIGVKPFTTERLRKILRINKPNQRELKRFGYNLFQPSDLEQYRGTFSDDTAGWPASKGMARFLERTQNLATKGDPVVGEQDVKTIVLKNRGGGEP